MNEVNPFAEVEKVFNILCSKDLSNFNISYKKDLKPSVYTLSTEINQYRFYGEGETIDVAFKALNESLSRV